MKAINRPKPVTILCVILFIYYGFLVLGGISGLIALTAGILTESPMPEVDGENAASGLGIAALYLVVDGFLRIVAVVGLWHMRRWGAYLLGYLIVLNFLITFGFRSPWVYSQPSDWMLMLVGAAIPFSVVAAYWGRFADNSATEQSAPSGSRAREITLVTVAVVLTLSLLFNFLFLGATQRAIQVNIPVRADARTQYEIVQEIADVVHNGLEERILIRFPDINPKLLESIEMSFVTDTIMPLGSGDPTTTIALQVAIQDDAGAEAILAYGAEEIERVIQVWLRSASVVEQGYAAEFYRMFAEQGNARAQHDLAVSYRDGRGVPQSLVEAYAWLSTAASQGFAGANGERQALLQELTTAELEKAETLAQEYLEKYVSESTQCK